MRTKPGQRLWAMLLLGASLWPLSLRAEVTAPAPAALAPLIDAISQRIAIADKVALSKWKTRKPVEDQQREQAVLAAISAEAPRFRLGSDQAQRFFSAQIEANKLVQYGLLWRWEKAGTAPSGPPPSLQDIRSQLDRLQTVLLERLAQFDPSRTDARCNRWLTSTIARAAVDDLHRWALVRATGELCARPE